MAWKQQYFLDQRGNMWGNDSPRLFQKQFLLTGPDTLWKQIQLARFKPSCQVRQPFKVKLHCTYVMKDNYLLAQIRPRALITVLVKKKGDWGMWNGNILSKIHNYLNLFRGTYSSN